MLSWMYWSLNPMSLFSPSLVPPLNSKPSLMNLSRKGCWVAAIQIRVEIWNRLLVSEWLLSKLIKSIFNNIMNKVHAAYEKIIVCCRLRWGKDKRVKLWTWTHSKHSYCWYFPSWVPAPVRRCERGSLRRPCWQPGGWSRSRSRCGPFHQFHRHNTCPVNIIDS